MPLSEKVTMKVRVSFRNMLIFLPLLALLASGAAPAGKWQLIDRFKNVSEGEWVKLKYTGGSEHLLLVAARDDKTITLEEKVREKDYTTSWTQTVIDMKKRTPVLLREKMLLTGEIREIPIEGEKPTLDEEFQALLTVRFWEEPGTQRVIVPAGKFTCKEYRAILDKKLIKIFFSSKIPLYPVKVVMPYYNLSIRLVDFGKGMESNFFPAKNTPPETGAGKSPLEEHSPAAPASPQAPCRSEEK